MVIELAEEGRTTREIAKEVHISLRDIGTIHRGIQVKVRKRSTQKRACP